MPATLPKVEALLGSRLDQVTHLGIQRLVDKRVVEDADLDFKREPHEDGEKLAADVSAMANTVGGVLVIGVEELDGVATSLAPLPLTDEATDRMKQFLAEYLVPYLATDIKRVPLEEDPTRGYYLVVVPRSPDAPHAVALRKKGSLRYYQRDGGRNRPLSESEVADAYRNRFRGARSQVDRLEAVRDDGVRAVAADRESVWLSLTLVPNAPGMMEISGRKVREVDTWARGYGGHRGDGPFETWEGPVMTGVGRVVLTSALQKEDSRPRFCHVELHRDGAGFAASEVLDLSRKEGEAQKLYGVDVLLRAAGLLRLLADHALENTGANGEALVRCELLAGDGAVMKLGFQSGNSWEPYARTRALAAPPAVGTHAISINAVATEPNERLLVTRLLLTDLVQAFGLPEVLHVTREGCLNTTYWEPRALHAWASMAGIPRVAQEIRY